MANEELDKLTGAAVKLETVGAAISIGAAGTLGADDEKILPKLFSLLAKSKLLALKPPNELILIAPGGLEVTIVVGATFIEVAGDIGT